MQIYVLYTQYIMKLPWYFNDTCSTISSLSLSLSLSLCRDVGGRTCFLDMEYEYFTEGCFEGALSNIHVDLKMLLMI